MGKRHEDEEHSRQSDRARDCESKATCPHVDSAKSSLPAWSYAG